MSHCLLYCCCSVTKSCPALCDPMDCSTPGFPVLHYLPEFAPIHVHWISDAIQPSHPLSLSSPFAFNPSQHQNPLQWVCSSHKVAKVLETQLQHQSFQWVFRVDFPSDWLVWSLCCPWNSKESSPAIQFESISSLVLTLLYCPTVISMHDYWKIHSFDYIYTYTFGFCYSIIEHLFTFKTSLYLLYNELIVYILCP